MKQTSLLLTALMTLILSCRSHSQLSGLERQMEETLEKGIQQGNPGISMLVKINGRVIRRQAGLASMEQQEKVTKDDVFRVASITKWLTMFVVCDLVDNQELAWTNTLTQILPSEITSSIPYSEQITIRHLFDHSSGIYSFTDGEDFQNYLSKDDQTHYRSWDLKEYLPFTDSTLHPPRFIPGTDTSYSNTGYILLGEIIEHITGKPYHEVLRERILDPLEMQATYVEGYDKPERKAVDSYQQTNDYFERVRGQLRYEQVSGSEYYNLSRKRPFNAWAYAAGAINSTPDDLLRLAEGILSNTISIPESWESALDEGYGIDGAGGSMGISASMYFKKDPEVIVIVLANTRVDDYQAFHMSNEVLDYIEEEADKEDYPRN